MSRTSFPKLSIRRFWHDRRGIAAVEFGYIVPLLLLMFVGTMEASRAIAMDRRFDAVTSMLADLIAREPSLKAADVNAIYGIVAQAMQPFDTSTLKVSIIPVKASPSDASNTKVYAATTNRPSMNGGAQPAKCSAYTLTSSMVPKGGSVIVIETQYTYTPVIMNFIYGTRSWTHKAIASPRNSCVDFDSDNCVSTCF